MSIPTFAWAREQGAARQLATATRCLLMVLADMARLDDGRLLCRALQSTLSWETGIKQRSLILHLQLLEASGLIAIEPCGRSQNYVILRPMNGADNAHVKSRNGANPASVIPPKGADNAHVNGADNALVEPDMCKIQQRHVQNLTTTCAESAPPYFKRTKKENQEREEPPLVPPQAGGKRGKPLPADWRPSSRSIALGFDLGMTQAEVLFEVEAMRDWASHKGETSLDWNARLNGWLRRGHRQKLPPQRLVQAKEARYAEQQDAFRQAHAAAKAREMVQ